ADRDGHGPQGRARTRVLRSADQGDERRRSAQRSRQPHPEGTRRMAVIPVDLAGRSYEVRVGSGLLADLPAQCGALLRKPRVPIITDANVAQHWRDPVQQSLETAGFEPRWLGHEPGEGAKTWSGLELTMNWLLAE